MDTNLLRSSLHGVGKFLPRRSGDRAVARGRTLLTSMRRRRDWADVEAFCLFVGYPRSGHSLLGALLNAHPEAVIAHELNVLRDMEAGLSRSRLYGRILTADHDFAQRGRRWEGYDYTVQGGQQGCYGRLRVIGDKKGGETSLRVLLQPTSLERLRRTVGVSLRVIHMTRNPFDNIATIAQRTFDGDLDRAIAWFEGFCCGVDLAMTYLESEEVWTTRHEELLASPRPTLIRACEFLGLRADDDYLEVTTKVINPRPSRTRRHAGWSDGQVDRVRSIVDRHPQFAGYEMDGD